MSISSTTRLACALLALGACNALLGLDESVPDVDRDGIADPVDNCPLDPNPQQRDRDANGLGDVCDCTASGVDVDGDGTDDACDDCVGAPTGEDSGGDGIDDGCEACAAAMGEDLDADGIDDACDPCAKGPDHDEDGDSVADACDNCPAQPNPDQALAPQGTLGAACANGLATQVVFDPFVEQDPTLWPGTVTGWSWIADGVVLDAALVRTLQLTISPPLLAETRLETERSVSLECGIGGGSTICRYDVTTQQVVITALEGGGASFDAANVPPIVGPVRMRMRSSLASSSCEVLDAAGGVLAQAQLASTPGCSRIRVSSTAPSRLEYLWIAGD